MIQYVKSSHDLIANFESFEIIYVLSEENNHDDALANLGSSYGIIMKRMIPFTYLEELSIDTSKLKEVANIEEASED